MKTYKVRFNAEVKKMTLKEIVDHNCKILANAGIRTGKVSEYDLKLLPSKLEQKIHWDKLSAEELSEIGFAQFCEGIWLAPRFIWNLIPVGTKLYSVKGHTKIVKDKNTPIDEDIMGMLPYGFKKKGN